MTSAIFSPESEFGATAFDALGGQTITQFGAALAPANLSARQAAALDLLTSGTCGPRGSTSSRSAALQESLASRLQARTGSGGSILYRLTWRTRATPSGRPICALRGSPNKTAQAAAFICGSDSISPQPAKGWPTPKASGDENDLQKFYERQARTKAKWPDKGMGMPIGPTAQLAGWPTPVTNDAEKRGAVDPMRGAVDPMRGGNGLAGKGGLAGWPTPTSGAAEGGQCYKDGTTTSGQTPDGRKIAVTLPNTANAA